MKLTLSAATTALSLLFFPSSCCFAFIASRNSDVDADADADADANPEVKIIYHRPNNNKNLRRSSSNNNNNNDNRRRTQIVQTGGSFDPTAVEGWVNPARQPHLCVSTLGNGLKLGGHYGSLARIAEQFGPIDCAAGGSSASTSVMAVETVSMNPILDLCGDETSCDNFPPETRRAREALLYKSMSELTDIDGLIEVSWRAFFGALDTIVKEFVAMDIVNQFRTNPFRALFSTFRVLLAAAPVINTDLVQIILTSPDPVFHAQDIVVNAIQGILNGGEYVPEMMVRPGLVDMDSLAELAGLLYTWYSGYNEDIYDPVGTDAWMDACAVPAIGLNWEETKALVGSDGVTTCGQEFANLYNTYYRNFRGDKHRNRIDDDVGFYNPMFVNCGVLTGSTLEAYNQAEEDYYAARTVSFNTDWDETKYGWFGNDLDMAAVEINLPLLFPDSPTANKFFNLEQRSYRIAVPKSIAEPNLSDGLRWEGKVAVGGWVGVGTQIYMGLNPQYSISITAERGGFASFLINIATFLGASAEQINNDLWREYNVAIGASNGIWCTTWNNKQFGYYGPEAMPDFFNDAYNARFGTRNDGLVAGNYYNTMPFVAVGGCIPIDPDYIVDNNFVGNATEVLTSLFPGIDIPANFTIED